VPELLGVRQESLPAYGSGVNLHYELADLVAQTERFVALGYPGIKLKVGSPDLGRDLERVAAVRAVLGPGRWLAVDANQRWTAEIAVRAVNALATYDLRWIEEPVRAEDLAGLVRVRSETPVPVAAGENVHTWYRFRELVEAGALDVVQPNVVRVGGLTPFRQIARLVSAAGLELAPHLLADLSAQVAVTLPERVWVEEVEDTGFERLGLVRSPTPVERHGPELRVRPAPGLGLEFR
jgi:L-alanine-DL-glutamate epimerase-like enolase superfamily enzyme